MWGGWGKVGDEEDVAFHLITPTNTESRDRCLTGERGRGSTRILGDRGPCSGSPVGQLVSGKEGGP